MAHLLSALILILICKLVFDCLVRHFSVPLALIIVTPFALQFASGIGDADYLSLSTELLPLLFLVVATNITYRHTLRNRNIFFIGLLFGLSVFGKYFFAPLAFIGLIMALLKARSDGLRLSSTIKWMTLGFCLPIFLLMSWAISAGVPLWKITESPLMTFQYLQGGGLASSSCTVLTRIGNIRNSLSAHVATFSLLLLGISLYLRTAIGLKPRHQILRFLIILSPPVVAIFLLLSNCMVFPHYNYLLIGGILQSFFASLYMSEIDKKLDLRIESRIIILLYAFVIMQILLTNVTQAVSAPLTNPLEKSSRFFSASAGLWERAWDKDKVPLSSFCKTGDSVLVWGWSPELYSFYGWEPASRYVTTTLMIDQKHFSHDTNYYRAKLAEDVELANLDCLVVAIGASFFGEFGENDSIKVQMPEFWEKAVVGLEVKTFYWDDVNPVTVLVPRQSGD